MCLCAQITSGTPLVWHFSARVCTLASERQLKLNYDSTQICFLLVFLEVKIAPDTSFFSFTFLCFFCSIPPSAAVLIFCAVLTPLKHSTSLSAMFVYIHVPPNNPINARAPSLGPRLSLSFEVSYYYKANQHLNLTFILLQHFSKT